MIYRLLWVATLILQRGAFGQSTAPARLLDVSTFVSLNGQSQLSILVATLAERELALDGISYAVEEREENVSLRDGRITPLGQARFEVRKHSDQIWMRLVRMDADRQVIQQGEADWNGTLGRTVAIQPSRGNHTAFIQDREDPNFGFRRYNSILGLRPITPVGTILQSIRSLKDSGQHPDVTIDQSGAEPLLRTRVADGAYHTRTFWFSVPKALMPMGFEYSYVNGSDSNFESIWVTASRLVDGLWVPESVVRKSRSSAVPDLETRTTYAVESIQFVELDESDLSVAFPPGTDVVDTVSHIAYRIRSDGSHELRPLYSASSGQVTVGGKAVSTNGSAPVRSTTEAHQREPIGPLSLLPPEGNGQESRVIPTLVVGALSVLVGVILIRKRAGKV